MKTTFVPKFVLIFYIYSSNHSLPRFWFYLRYTNKSIFGLYILSCNPFLYFISTPYNRSPTCIFGLTLDINKKSIQNLVLSFFLLFWGLRISSFPYFVQLFPCCVENLLSRYSPPIMQGPSARNSVELGSFCYYFFCLYLTFGECCESVP